MKVKCIMDYFDKQFNKSVKVGEVFDVAEDRANVLIKAKVCEATTPTTEEVEKPATKKRQGRKKVEG